MMKRPFKISHMISSCLIFIILVFAGIIAYTNFISLRQIRENELTGEQKSINNLVHILDSELNSSAVFVNNFLTDNSDLVDLKNASEFSDQYFALMELRENLSKYTLLSNVMTEYFFYSADLGNMGYLSNGVSADNSISADTHTRIDTFLEKYLGNGYLASWNIIDIDGQSYLVYINQSDNDYAGCWCSIDSFTEEITQYLNSSDHYFITNSSGTSKANSYMYGEKINLDSSTYTSSAEHLTLLQVVQESTQANIYLVEHHDRTQAESAIHHIQFILMLTICILIAVLIGLSLFLRKYLYQPVYHLVKKMNSIAQNNANHPLPIHTKLSEIQHLDNSLNQMSEDIRHMKIDIYERQIFEQKIQLQFLQSRIYPHFIVNALNTVRAMINTELYDAADEMCCYLADYCRYLTMQKVEMVALIDEIDAVTSFIRIQQLRQISNISFTCEMDPTCSHILIPPLTLITFVENCLKYGQIPNERRVNISVRIRKESDSIFIQIRDSGPGFPEALIENIRNHQTIRHGKKSGVGISNTLTRLTLFYGEQVSVKIYNENGAVVLLRIFKTVATSPENDTAV